MRARLNLISQGIVSRLRFTFIVIVVILVTQLTIGFILVRSLNQSVDDLTQSAFSVFLITEESERELKNLLLLLRQVDTVATTAGLEPLRSQLEKSLDTLRAVVDRMEHADLPKAASTKMVQALEDIRKNSVVIAKAKGAALANADKIRDFEKQLLALRQNKRRILEGLSFDANLRATEGAKLETDQSPLARERLNEHISDNLALANTLTTITLQLESIFVKAQGFKNLSTAEALSVREQELRFDIRSVVVLTSQIAPSSDRTDLAQALSQLRSLLFDTDGLAEVIFTASEQRQTLDALLLAQTAPMTSISALSQGLNANAIEQVAAARSALSQTTQTLTLLAALTTFVSLIGIGLANMFVVERQINRRVARLTDAVLSIANGQTKYNVNVQGDDELGKIALALETFKINAEELNRSNAELEKFAYAAAHDMRSPLRAIQDLVQWTLEDPDNALSEDGHQNMIMLQNRVLRLNALLSDLLDYSRVGQEEMDISELQVGHFVRDISDLVDPDNRYNITYNGSADPVMTYATPLRQILLNLISNSVKHHDRDTGNITVTGHVEDGRIHLSVADDGPGIPIPYQDRVFGLFETLKSRDEVEGSGLGLSIILKSLDHYDGSITIQSDPDAKRGATFLFDLPETTPAQAPLRLVA